MSRFNIGSKSYSTVSELASLALLQGNTADLTSKIVFGQNTDIDANSEEDIWQQGGARSWFTAAQTVSVASSSAQDGVEGTGALTVFLIGLNEDHETVFEFITMNGTTPVVSTNTYWNMELVLVVTYGSNGSNVGNITMTGDTDATVNAAISVGTNTTQMSHYQIPAGFVGYLLDTTISSYRSPGSGGGTREAEITQIIHPVGGAPYRVSKFGIRSAISHLKFDNPLRLAPMTKIWYTGDAAANNTALSIQYNILLVNSNYVK